SASVGATGSCVTAGILGALRAVLQARFSREHRKCGVSVLRSAKPTIVARRSEREEGRWAARTRAATNVDWPVSALTPLTAGNPEITSSLGGQAQSPGSEILRMKQTSRPSLCQVRFAPNSDYKRHHGTSLPCQTSLSR